MSEDSPNKQSMNWQQIIVHTVISTLIGVVILAIAAIMFSYYKSSFVTEVTMAFKAEIAVERKSRILLIGHLLTQNLNIPTNLLLSYSGVEQDSTLNELLTNTVVLNVNSLDSTAHYAAFFDGAWTPYKTTPVMYRINDLEAVFAFGNYNEYSKDAMRIGWLSTSTDDKGEIIVASTFMEMLKFSGSTTDRLVKINYRDSILYDYWGIEPLTKWDTLKRFK